MQEINLYHALPSKAKVKLPSELVLQICGAFAIVLVLYSGFSKWQQAHNEERVVTLNKQLQQAQEKTEALKLEYPKIAKDDLITAEINDLEQQKILKAAIIKRLNGGHDTRGFATYFVLFAKEVPQGLWLTHITLDNDSNRIALKGKTINASLVAQFASTLNNSPLLKGKNLRVFSIVEPTENDGTVEFDIDSQVQ